MTRKLWSVPRIKHPQYAKFTVRVAEYTPGGSLHAFMWKDHKQISRSLKCRRVDLGSTAKVQVQEARRLGCLFIAGLATAPPEDDPSSPHTPRGQPLTLTALAARLERDGYAGKTTGYKRDSLASIRRVAAFFEPALLVRDLKPSHLAKYIAQRVAEKHGPGGRGNLIVVSIACNWAVGEGWLTENPIANKRARDAMRINHQPKRPYVTKDRYEKLHAVAPQLPPAFAPLLELAWHTGHRIAAILGLRWEHINFTATADAPFGTIRWYADCIPDKKKHDHTLPMNQSACTALRAWLRQRGKIVGAGCVFPSPADHERPLGKLSPQAWMKRAERLANLPHLDGGSWHPFRRGWATARKDQPLKDVAAGGGWTDTQTVTKCYQHADAEATKAVCLFVA